MTKRRTRWHLFIPTAVVAIALLAGGCSSSNKVSDLTIASVPVSTSDVLTSDVSTAGSSVDGPVALPAVTDPVVGFESNDGKRMIVAGAVRTEAERAALISASKTSFVGYEINDQLLVSDKALSIPDVGTMVDALAQVGAPISFVYTGANYRLRGTVTNEATRLAVEASLRASLGPITVPFSNELTIAP